MARDYITVYLAGACEHVPDWRKDAMAAFYKIAKYDELKACVINPSDYDQQNQTDRQIKSFLFSKIRQSDVMLVNLNYSSKCIGLAQEIQHAVDQYVPIVAYGRLDVHPWLANVDCDVVFNTLEEAIEYIRDYYMASSVPIGVGA